MPTDAASALSRACAAPGHPAEIGRLLELQFHFFGRDASDHRGNLIRRVGFRREGAPRGRRTAVSRYVFTHDGLTVVLWPFALFAGDARGAALIPRRGRPSWHSLAAAPDIHTLRDLTRVRRHAVPCPGPTLARALSWIVPYERTIGTLVGDRHRTPANMHDDRAARSSFLLDDAWSTHLAWLGNARPATAPARPAPQPAQPSTCSTASSGSARSAGRKSVPRV